jgi:hypothetical protein
MTVQFSNNAVSLSINTLGLTDTVLAINVADAVKFPSLTVGQWYPLTLVNASSEMEIVRCTARAGNLLTIARQQEGTAARNFPIGSIVNLRVTKALLEDLRTLPAGAFGLALLGATSLTDAQFLLDVPVSFANWAALQAATVEPGTLQIEMRGFAAYGDHKPVIYKYVAAEPAHNLKIKSQNNLWFEIAEKDVRPEYIGGGPATADNWTAIASCFGFLKEKTNAGSIIFSAGKTYNVTTQAFYTALMPNHVSLISDEPGKQFTLDFSGRSSWTGYTAALIDIAGQFDTASQQFLTEDIQPPQNYVVTAGTAVGNVCTLTIGPHSLTAGKRAYVYFASSDASISEADEGYLTMADSNEGMSLTVPVEITAIPAVDKIQYTALPGHTPGATLTQPYNVEVMVNSNIFHVGSTTDYNVGDMVAVTTDLQYAGHSGGVVTNYAEMGKIVRKVDANRLEFERGVKFDYLTANNAKIFKLICKTLFMRDAQIVGKGYNPGAGLGTQTDIGIRAFLCDQPTYQNVTVKNCDYHGIFNVSCYRALEVECSTIADQRNRQGLATGAIPYSYGHTYAGMCYNPRYIRCSSDGGRHQNVESTTSDLIGMPFDVQIIDFVGKNSMYGSISTHDMIFSIDVDGGIFNNCAAVFDMRNGGVTAKRIKIYGTNLGIRVGGLLDDTYVDVDYAENVSSALFGVYPTAESPAVSKNLSFRIRAGKNIARIFDSFLPTGRVIKNMIVDASGVEDVIEYGFNCGAAVSEFSYYYACTFIGFSPNCNAQNFAVNRITNAQRCIFQDITPSMTYVGTVYPLLISTAGPIVYGDNIFRNVKAVLGSGALDGDLYVPAGSSGNSCDTILREFVTVEAGGVCRSRFTTPKVVSIAVPATADAIAGIADGHLFAVKGSSSAALIIRDQNTSLYAGTGAFETNGSTTFTMSSSRNVALFLNSSGSLLQCAPAGTA